MLQSVLVATRSSLRTATRARGSVMLSDSRSTHSFEGNTSTSVAGLLLLFLFFSPCKISALGIGSILPDFSQPSHHLFHWYEVEQHETPFSFSCWKHKKKNKNLICFFFPSQLCPQKVLTLGGWIRRGGQPLIACPHSAAFLWSAVSSLRMFPLLLGIRKRPEFFFRECP